MNRALLSILVIIGLAACNPPKPGEESKAGPGFVVETWEGKKSTGPIALCDGRLSADRHRLPIGDVQIITRETPAGAPRMARRAGRMSRRKRSWSGNWRSKNCQKTPPRPWGNS